MSYSNRIIFVDESGDPNLRSTDPNYPVFVLNFCVFEKDHYAGSVLPAVASFKFTHFGHDLAVLHENDIRLSKPPFVFLHDKDKRQLFMDGVTQLIDHMDVTIIAAVVDKRQLRRPYTFGENPSQRSLLACLERAHTLLDSPLEDGGVTHVVVESRGQRENERLRQDFLDIINGNNSSGQKMSGFEITFADKKTNSTGLQIADLTARPIGRHYIDPEQPNRAWTSLSPKLLRSPEGEIDGWGITKIP